MVETGWKHPQTVDQDSRNELNNGRRCYPWRNIINIKKNDYSYTDINPWEVSGIDLDHKSPILYGYNYGFNLPDNAVVKKITLFVLVQQLTHTKPKYDPTGKWRYSVSKFESVRLKLGSSTQGLGQGTEFASKSAMRNLPYKTWSTESQTTFTGTPEEWGLDATNIIPTINSGNFGIAVQFIGTIKNAWNTPAVAQLKMNIEYEVPELKDDNPSTFEKLTLNYKLFDDDTEKEVIFDETTRESQVLGTLLYNDYDNPIRVFFNFYHKGNAGETPTIVCSSTSLIMGPNLKSWNEKKTSAGKYSLPSVHCGGDENPKKYSRTLIVYPGLLLGEQEIKYKYDDKIYTLRFNVDAEGLSDTDKARFMNTNQQCMMKDCVFMMNKAQGMGGANYITSEYYYFSGNIYGVENYRNVAYNKWKQNNGNGCDLTHWVGCCLTYEDTDNTTCKKKNTCIQNYFGIENTSGQND